MTGYEYVKIFDYVSGAVSWYMCIMFCSWLHFDKIQIAPGEARTHNLRITPWLSYKYGALTDCATGAAT